MKQILAIIGSPRKLGNCEIMVKEISNNITEPHELKLLRLSDFNILPCIGCYMCLIKQKGCVLKDDFNLVSQAIIEADALILSAPTYFLGANSCLKRFTDRGLAMYSHTDKLWGKPAIGIGIAGIPGKEGYTLLGIESFLKLLLADVKQAKVIYGALPGEIFMNKENINTASQMAQALFADTSFKNDPCCPLCGGQTFRFMENNKVQCMLCSNSGTFEVKENKPCFKINKSEHELFLTRQDVIDHGKWLVSMKSRFMEHKNDLKKISLNYRKTFEQKEWNWIKP